jgi:hypothetical protein
MRINIRQDGKFAGWFDPDKTACQWAAAGFDGGSTLYRTIADKWVVEDWLRTGDATYRFVTTDDALDWLRAHDMAAEAGRLSTVGRTGRPEIGGLVKIRLGGLLPAVDALAARLHLSRADAVRHLVHRGLQAEGNQQP